MTGKPIHKSPEWLNYEYLNTRKNCDGKFKKIKYKPEKGCAFQLMIETHPIITLLLPSGMFMVATALLPANSGSVTHNGHDS